MTREEKLYSMRMQDLVNVADKLGIKINTKAAKSKAVETILAAEEMNKQNEKEIAKEEKQIKKIIEEPKLVPMPGTEDPNWGEKHWAADDVAEVSSKPESKRERGKLIEYDGRSQNLCAWARELGVSTQMLYARLYISKWDVEKAFTYKITK